MQPIHRVKIGFIGSSAASSPHHDSFRAFIPADVELTFVQEAGCDGRYEKFSGVIQNRYGDQKDEVQRWADDWYSEREQEEIRRRHATISRDQI